MTTEIPPTSASLVATMVQSMPGPLPGPELPVVARTLRRSAESEHRHARAAREDAQDALARRRVALLCREPAESTLWPRVREEARALAKRGTEVHLFCTEPVPIEEPIRLHPLGVPSEGDLIEQAQDFARRVRDAVAHDLGCAVPVLAYEWGTIPALLALGEGPRTLCLQSLERQRSDDMSRPLSAAIEEMERKGLAAAKRTIIRDPAIAAHAEYLLPGCMSRLVEPRWMFPSHEYAPVPDPGQVKARYHVGPLDPTILFIGDLDWRHGPDLLVKAMPPVLKNNPQARLIVVGDGELLWPLRVQARYMLLDHAVRIVGDVTGQAVRELIASADMVVVPSRVQTEDWQILSGWAAGRPVVATHEVADPFCVHEEDSVLIYSNHGSCVWGIERVLFDPALAERLSARGRERLDELHGWGAVAGQLEELLFPAERAES